MGCWNATCNISNLPIFAGEKVVVIPLIKTMSKTRFNCCYPFDNFTPLGYPIIGEYDDYGGIDNATTIKVNEDHLRSLEYFYENTNIDAKEKFRPAEKHKDFERFVNEILCCHEGAYIKTHDNILHPNGMAEINFMMIHYDLYTRLVEEMGNRIPYGKESTYRELLAKKAHNVVENYRGIIKNGELIESEVIDEDAKKKVKALNEMLRHHSISEMTHKLFVVETAFRAHVDKWNYFSNLLVDNKELDDIIIEQVVEQNLFITALSYMRKGFLCDSGCGSQSCETKLHMILANFIKEHVEKLAETVGEDCGKEDKILLKNEGMAETIFFFN